MPNFIHYAPVIVQTERLLFNSSESLPRTFWRVKTPIIIIQFFLLQKYPGVSWPKSDILLILLSQHTIPPFTRQVCVCVFSSRSFWTLSSLDVPAGVTQEEGHTGFLIHLLSAVRALIFLARRIQPFFSLVDREVEF